MSEVYQIPGLCLTVLCHSIASYNINSQKYSKKIFVLCSLVYAFLFVCLMGCGFAAGGWNAFISYIGIVTLFFLYFCVVSRDGFPKKSFCFMTYACLFSVLDNMLKLMVKLFLPQLSEVVGYYVAIVLRSIIILFGVILYKKYAEAVLRSLGDSGKNWWNLALTALLFYVLQVAVTVLTALKVVSDVQLLFIFAAVSITMCVVYGIIFNYINYMKKDFEAALVYQNIEYLSDRLSVMQNAEEENRRIRHDIRHHMEAVAEYAKAGDTSAILSYIEEYNNEISKAAVKQYSLNLTVNSILSVYADKARGSGISFSVRCNVPKDIKVRKIDLIALIGNLLENALHGCQESGKEKPYIEIHVLVQKDRLVIVCNNSCTDKLELSGRLPAGKSIGISSILSVCQRYDGNLDYKIGNEICSACAVLNL